MLLKFSGSCLCPLLRLLLSKNALSIRVFSEMVVCAVSDYKLVM